VENFPGYPNGVVGPQLMEDLRLQAERFGTRVNMGVRVTKVDFSGPVHKAWTDAGEEIHAHTVIVATGAEAKWLGLESEKAFTNKGVSACAVCDGFFFRGQEVAVVGGGDTAAEEATYLSKMCKKVHLLVRGDKLRASKIMQERVFSTENLEVHFNSSVDEILGDDRGVNALRLVNNVDKSLSELAVTGLFIAIGHKPNTEIFKEWLEMDESAYLITKGKTTHTNRPGIFVCGDAQDNIYRQAVTAAGTGCMSALDAERYLAEHKLI